MDKHLWLSLIVTLFVQGAIGQTDGSAARHEKIVEENLRYLAVIKGRPDPGMSLTDQMLRLHVPGVSIAVIHDKRIDWSKGYGVARLGGPPVSASTLFGAASMSKPVTAMAVLRLVQEGKIDLDVDVNTYLKSWKIPANEYTKNHAVTVRELLSHTSGIGTHNGALYDPDKGVPSMLEILDGKPPATTPPVRVEWEPGKKYAYANGGHMILELLVSEFTGKPFAEVYRQLIVYRSEFAEGLENDADCSSQHRILGRRRGRLPSRLGRLQSRSAHARNDRRSRRSTVVAAPQAQQSRHSRDRH